MLHCSSNAVENPSSTKFISTTPTPNTALDIINPHPNLPPLTCRRISVKHVFQHFQRVSVSVHQLLNCVPAVHVHPLRKWKPPHSEKAQQYSQRLDDLWFTLKVLQKVVPSLTQQCVPLHSLWNTHREAWGWVPYRYRTFLFWMTLAIYI